MQLLLLLIALSVFVAMIIGLVRPSVVRMPNRKKVFLIYGLSSVVLLVIAAQIQPEPREQPASHSGPNHIEVKRQVPPQPETDAVDVEAALRENQKKMAEHRASKAYKPPTDRDVSRQQAWVYDNCYAGCPWDYEKITKAIGHYEEIEYTGSRNAYIIKALYFYYADVTIFYNNLKDTIVTFKRGQKGDWMD